MCIDMYYQQHYNYIKRKKNILKSTFGITNLTLHHFYMVTTNRLKKSVK